MNVEHVTTDDGSITLRDQDTGLLFGSSHGARTEARHVFVEAAILAVRRQRNSVRVFEFGFGGAMNFCETLVACRERGLGLDYVAVEKDPVDPDMLSHPDFEALEIAREALASPGAQIRAGDHRLEVVHMSFAQLTAVRRGFDAVYHDPFGPKTAPECWTEKVFRKHAELLVEDGYLATFSAATRVRQAMTNAGFYVATRPGPPGKREVTIASRISDSLRPYEIANEP